MAESTASACLTCRLNRGELPAPGGVIYQDAWWQLQHTIEPVPLLGWLVLKPLRHVEAFADLTDEEAATFGPLMRRITQAMTTVLRPAKIYVSLYAEAEGFAHLHVHLIPRSAQTPPERRGPRIFEYLRESTATGHNQVSLTAVEQTVNDLRRVLHPNGPG
jgi:diadenosine tetraphosphate (Ap4A) HIT family hydrolase